MSGGLYLDFREGNRSELLADYMLSAIGITTPVRRQDDFGFDFYCQLAEKNNKYVTFGYPFIIQIKSHSHGIIKYGKKDPNKWRKENTAWLFKNETPFFIGIVNKKKNSIKIYDTTGLWQVYNYGRRDNNWSQIELKSKAHIVGERRENCIREKLAEWPKDKGDGYKYTVDLGNPIIELTLEDLKADEILESKKEVLKYFITNEQTNIIHRKLGIIGFNEIKQNCVDSKQNIERGMALGAAGDGYVAGDVYNIYESFKTGLLSLLINLAALNRNDEIEAVKNVLRYLPPESYYDDLFKKDPNLFNWIKSLHTNVSV